MQNPMVSTLNIIMLTMKITEVNDGRTTGRKFTRASMFLELIIIIKMAEQSGTSDHYRTWYTVI